MPGGHTKLAVLDNSKYFENVTILFMSKNAINKKA